MFMNSNLIRTSGRKITFLRLPPQGDC